LSGPFDAWLGIVTFGTALGCGLIAGVFFAFSTFVMPALARLPAAQGIAAMNAINVAAITPTFNESASPPRSRAWRGDREGSRC
jgi:uncharacterized membrane protein